jgi:hypothetical protein
MTEPILFRTAQKLKILLIWDCCETRYICKVTSAMCKRYFVLQPL